MSVASGQPQGLSLWGSTEWKRFAQQQAPVGGEYPQRHFSGAFGGVEIAMLGALAGGYVSVETFAIIYGHSGEAMLCRWGDDLNMGIKDPTLEGLGVNDITFVESTLAQLSGLLD
ncbi:MAG: hypothetical protein ABII21_00155 [bacterium]